MIDNYKIEFSGFTLGAASSTEAQEDSNNTAFSRINDTTWSQVAGIMNLFSKWETSMKPDSSTEENYNPNLQQWTTTGQPSSNKWIDTDLVAPTTETGLASQTESEDSTDDNVVTKKWSSTKPDSSSGTYDQTIQESSSTLYRWHNNILWTYTKAENGTITIEGTAANLYKSKGPGSSTSTYYQKDGNSTEVDYNWSITNVY